MKKETIHKMLIILIAMVWLVNGLFCKVLHLVPRHQLIVSVILGGRYAGLLTTAIGLAEIGMAIWVVSGMKPRLCALTQVLLVAAMNLMEFFLVPHLLLFGKMNALLAVAFMAVVCYNEFFIRETNSGRPFYAVLFKRSSICR